MMWAVPFPVRHGTVPRGGWNMNTREIRCEDSPWLVRFNRCSRPRLRLLCFPFAGGSASYFLRWARLIPGEVELVGIQYPGRCSRLSEPGMTCLSSLIEAAAQAVAPLLDIGRMAFFGHSMGALVAYEVARWLCARGLGGPDHLFLSGRQAPGRSSPGPIPSILSDDALLGFLRRLGGMPEAVLNDGTLMAMILPGLRADLQALATWRYQPHKPLNIPLTIFCGEHDPEVLPSSMSSWAQQTTKYFSEHVLPGGHFFLNDHSESVLEIVIEALLAGHSDEKHAKVASL